MAVKNKLTVKMVRSAIERTKEFIRICEESEQRTNPQVITMKIHAQGRLDAYTAILGAMRGDVVFLKIDAGEI